MSHEESRPADDQAAPKINTTDVEDIGHRFHAEALRRRRAASHRLPPLDCGHRDPMDCQRDRPADLQASRRAWHHLRDHGLLSEVVVNVLRGAA
jgi:hypothetical protein